jgi:hypothetical protein
MAESILDTVSAAYEGLANPEPDAVAPSAETVAEVPAQPETQEQTDQRARDEAGRFAKQPKQPTLRLKEKPQEVAPQATTPQQVKPETASSAPVTPAAPENDKEGKALPRIPPPPGWDGVANLHWDRIPRPVRETIAKQYETIETARQELLPIKELIDTNREFLVNQAGSVQEAQRQMMQFARMSVDNPVALAEHILRSKGLDPRAVFSGQPQAAAQNQPPNVQAIVAQLVQEQLQPILAERDQQQTQQLQTTIDQFAQRPDRPFFNDVRVHMGQLIQVGSAKTLDEAYEQATWANPTIRAHLMDAEREAAGKAQAEQVQKAKAAQRASVTGSPIEGAVPPKGKSNGSAREAVMEAWNSLAE